MKRSFFQTMTSIFAISCILFIPFPFHITKIQLLVTDFIFGKLIGFVSSTFFDKPLRDTRVHSDSVSMYILLLLLFILSILISVLLLQIKKWPVYRNRVINFIYQLCIYYLALQLLKYGFDKIFKNQFYIPEPNTLYTPLGNVSKDLLYWSSMGTSHFYNVFLGFLEVLAAVFILIKRTRLVGLLLSFVIMVNVVAVNFGFDIAVKLYSLFLLFLTIYLLTTYWDRLYQLLLGQTAAPVKPHPESGKPFNKTFLHVFLKWLAIGLILLEVFYPFIKTKNFNGDLGDRPYLHGAYEVKQMILGTDTLVAAHSPIKKLFIHRDDYIIFQDQQDEMEDYKLTVDKEASFLILTDYQRKQTRLYFTYQSSDSILSLQYFNEGKEIKLVGKAIDWKRLPALQKSFHWTVD